MDVLDKVRERMEEADRQKQRSFVETARCIETAEAEGAPLAMSPEAIAASLAADGKTTDDLARAVERFRRLRSLQARVAAGQDAAREKRVLQVKADEENSKFQVVKDKHDAVLADLNGRI